MSPRHATAHTEAIQSASLTSDTCKAMHCISQALLCLGSRPLCVFSLHLPCIPLGDHLSFLAGEGRSPREAKHQGKGTAQQVLADFIHSQFTVPEEGPEGWKEQRQAGFSRSPGLWLGRDQGSQPARAADVDADGIPSWSKAADTAPAPCSCFHTSSPS